MAEIGGSYYLWNDSLSPYVGAGIMPRIAFGFGDGGVQLAPYGQLGLMFMRESSSRLYCDLRVAQLVTPFDKTRWDWEDGRERKVYPTELTVAVGIGW